MEVFISFLQGFVFLILLKIYSDDSLNVVSNGAEVERASLALERSSIPSTSYSFLEMRIKTGPKKPVSPVPTGSIFASKVLKNEENSEAKSKTGSKTTSKTKLKVDKKAKEVSHKPKKTKAVSDKPKKTKAVLDKSKKTKEVSDKPKKTKTKGIKLSDARIDPILEEEDPFAYRVFDLEPQNVIPQPNAEDEADPIFPIYLYKKHEDYGVISKVDGGIIYITGLDNLSVGEIVYFGRGLEQAITLNLERNVAKAAIFTSNESVAQGTPVFRTFRLMKIPVSQHLLGKVIDCLGNSLTPTKPVKASQGKFVFRAVDVKAVGVIDRKSINEPLVTGVLSIDAMLPIGRGQRELIIGDRQLGKTSLAVDSIISQKNLHISD